MEHAITPVSGGAQILFYITHFLFRYSILEKISMLSPKHRSLPGSQVFLKKGIPRVYDTAKQNYRKSDENMYQITRHKPRTILLHLGGPGRKAGINYPYWILTICSFLSSGDRHQKRDPGDPKIILGIAEDTAPGLTFSPPIFRVTREDA